MIVRLPRIYANQQESLEITKFPWLQQVSISICNFHSRYAMQCVESTKRKAAYLLVKVLKNKTGHSQDHFFLVTSKKYGLLWRELYLE